MVKYTEILKAVNEKIKSKFPAIPILSQSDVSEKIIRPSFMTMLDNIDTENFTFDTADKECKVIIHYFASDKDKNKIENLNMIDDLEELFLENNQLEIVKSNGKKFLIGIEEAESETVDKVLNFSFDLEFSDEWIRPDNDGVGKMEDLNIKEEING